MSGKNLEKGNTTTQSVTKNTQHIAAHKETYSEMTVVTLTQYTNVVAMISESDLLK
jgi:hypothetical protein